MHSDHALQDLIARLAHDLLAARHRLVTAESCTGGWIAKVLTDMPGSSQWFECGFVTYSDVAKLRDLGVAAATLAQHGAVSEATVREMASGALRVSGADLALSVSGIAGPDGGSQDKPVGTVWFGIARRDGNLHAHLQHFIGDRNTVRYQAVRYALQLLIQYA